MSLVCVLGSFRASACAFRVSELLVVRLSFVAKLFSLRCVSCEIPKFSCRVLNSSFSFEFVVEIFDSNFEFKFLEFSCRILKSNFEFVFFVSLLYSTSRIQLLEFQFSIRISNSSSLIFRVEIFDVLLYSTSRISIRICRRNFRFVALFDFSNFVALFDFSKSIVKFDFSKFEFSIRLLDSSPLNLMIRNCRRISNSS